MAKIVTRADKGSALTHSELDGNFTALVESGSINDTTDVDINLSIDKVTVTGSAADKTTVIGDAVSGGYAQHGFTVSAGDTAFAQLELKENEGTSSKPVAQGFTNPGISSTISGGTTASPAALGSGKRIMGVFGSATLDANGTTPYHSQAAIKMETTQAQTSSACGAKMELETSVDGRGSGSTDIRITSLRLQGSVATFNPSGDATITTGGNLKLDDDVIITGSISNDGGDVTVNDNLKVNTNLTVDGNTVLGNANTDTITCNAKLTAVNGFVNTILNTSTANSLAGAGAIDEGAMAYISDGNAGAKCLAFFDGTNWKKAHSPADNIASS
jgi:hypothetical protein